LKPNSGTRSPGSVSSEKRRKVKELNPKEFKFKEVNELRRALYSRAPI